MVIAEWKEVGFLSSGFNSGGEEEEEEEEGVEGKEEMAFVGQDEESVVLGVRRNKWFFSRGGEEKEEECEEEFYQDLYYNLPYQVEMY